ncbi:carboxypeptidase-like regulatory domain-containing protein [Mucilaginibacter sp. dw_454]|uniref:carboxypeptidase-like regulatory domain-containing protein n=1 Tax=Mucilaginibacter sp. dw_454 TaxID=2720079 RepID=UPI001BD49A28|nr:carboxypeptidase-like regulatory domain-containing protein [Mucilaginibacter sp. dw_454]
MKPTLRNLIFCLLLLICSRVSAQKNVYIISGKVTGENNLPVNHATVFINGSQMIATTNAEGKFEIALTDPGSYQVSVKVMGYAPYSQDVRVKDKSVVANIELTVKSIMLQPVDVGAKTSWAKNYAIFKSQFLGTSDNAKNCEILNPEVLNFKTNKNLLSAEADDFLIIENKSLGYRIKYALKAFTHNTTELVTSYDGDTNFEELQGTDEQKKEWSKKRLEAYKGSMMHFMRSVFNNKTASEGFVAYKSIKANLGFMRIDTIPVKFETLVTALDTSFISLKFVGLHIIYDPENAVAISKGQAKLTPTPIVGHNVTKNISELFLYLKEAIVDGQGGVFSGYRTFLIRGDWTNKRIGDELPFEYEPDATNTSSP